MCHLYVVLIQACNFSMDGRKRKQDKGHYKGGTAGMVQQSFQQDDSPQNEENEERVKTNPIKHFKQF